MNYLHAMVSAVCLFLVAGPALAQHHHGGHHGGHAQPRHHGVYFGHQNWHHVVPHHQTYAGAYYTVGSNHFYTPSPVVPIVTAAPQFAGPPPRVVEVQRPVELSFNGFSRSEDLAGRMAVVANALCLDMHYNYRHNRNFAEVYGEAYGVLQAAKYIHGKEHQGDRDTIRNRMVEVDRLFHHVQDEMRGWTRAANRQIGPDTLPEKLAGMEAVLHHLCYDVGVKPHEQPAEDAPPPGNSEEVAPPPPVRRP